MLLFITLDYVCRRRNYIYITRLKALILICYNKGVFTEKPIPKKRKDLKEKEKKTVLKTKRRTIWQAWGSTKLKLYA